MQVFRETRPGRLITNMFSTVWSSSKTVKTLTIEPGTVIKGKLGQGADASALVVARWWQDHG